MSLSRPARFPLLKLPILCIKDVVRSWDIFDIIIFAVISQKTRQIVKHLKISLNEIEVHLKRFKRIALNSSIEDWHFRNLSKLDLFKYHPDIRKDCLVLQNNEISLYTRRTGSSLESYTDGDKVNALKFVMDFLNEVFKCSIECVDIDVDIFPESGDIGVRSTLKLIIRNQESRTFGHAQKQKLNLLLENLEVNGTCTFWVEDTENSFYVDPKRFKCKQLMFLGSVAWVTREILLQFDVPRLTFIRCPFSVEDILSFVTQWFHSDNMKFELLYIPYQRQKISLETFQTAELNPVPFSGRTRVPSSESFGGNVDFSKGLELVRHDGLQATIHVGEENFMFYIWHNQ